MGAPATKFHVYVDESYRPNVDGRRIIVGFLVVPQDRWLGLRSASYSFHVKDDRAFVDRLHGLLADLHGTAVLAYSDLSSSQLPTRERDRAADVPDMARTDNAWAATFTFGLLHAVLRTGLFHLSASTLRVFHDARDLKGGHLSAIQGSITRQFAKELALGRERGYVPTQFRPRVEPIRFVAKSMPGSGYSSSQAGVAHVDRLLRVTLPLLEAPELPLILVADVTSMVADYLSHYSEPIPIEDP